ncbi:hypothetical protein TcBrA4_0020500 [Trypanosoma cruzi]|nr:hypothetical protein TcBrA4_0020500 [Trypanosoma cruzi]
MADSADTLVLLERAAAPSRAALYVLRIVYEWLHQSETLFHVCMFRIMNGGSVTGLYNPNFRVRTLDNFAEHNPQTDPLLALGGDRFRAAAAPHVVVYVFVSNYEWRTVRCCTRL